MSKNLETVKGIYEAFGRGDVPAILGTFRDDIVWEYDSVDHGIPWLKPLSGKNKVASFFQGLSALDIRSFEPTSFMEGENSIAVVIRVQLAVKVTGKKVRDLEVHLWTFDEKGLAQQFRHVLDTHQHYLASH